MNESLTPFTYGSFDIQVWRWSCPLRACPWVQEFQTEDSARAAFLRSGVVYDHIHSHDVLEWAQEVIDLRKSEALG